MYKIWIRMPTHAILGRVTPRRLPLVQLCNELCSLRMRIKRDFIAPHNSNLSGDDGVVASSD